MTMRPSWDDYFLGIAYAAATRGECARSQVAAVLVRDRRVVSTGYNGVEAGAASCLDGACPRGLSGVPRRSQGGPGYDVSPCVALHAEDNVLLDCTERGVHMRGATMYLTKEPCPRCRMRLFDNGIRVIWYDKTRKTGGREGFPEWESLNETPG
jgi:dCMP deaminase